MRLTEMQYTKEQRQHELEGAILNNLKNPRRSPDPQYCLDDPTRPHPSDRGTRDLDLEHENRQRGISAL